MSQFTFKVMDSRCSQPIQDALKAKALGHDGHKASRGDEIVGVCGLKAKDTQSHALDGWQPARRNAEVWAGSRFQTCGLC